MTTEPTSATGLDAAPGPSVDGSGGSRETAIAGLSFDDAFAELRAAVAELEAGGLSLEETIARTERAVALQRHCERLLAEAELRVKQLVSRPGGALEARDIVAEDAVEG